MFKSKNWTDLSYQNEQLFVMALRKAFVKLWLNYVFIDCMYGGPGLATEPPYCSVRILIQFCDILYFARELDMATERNTNKRK